MNDPDGFGKPVALQGHEMKPRLTFYDLSAKGVPHDRCLQPVHTVCPCDALSALRNPALTGFPGVETPGWDEMHLWCWEQAGDTFTAWQPIRRR